MHTFYIVTEVNGDLLSIPTDGVYFMAFVNRISKLDGYETETKVHDCGYGMIDRENIHRLKGKMICYELY